MIRINGHYKSNGETARILCVDRPSQGNGLSVVFLVGRTTCLADETGRAFNLSGDRLDQMDLVEQVRFSAVDEGEFGRRGVVDVENPGFYYPTTAPETLLLTMQESGVSTANWCIPDFVVKGACIYHKGFNGKLVVQSVDGSAVVVKQLYLNNNTTLDRLPERYKLPPTRDQVEDFLQNKKFRGTPCRDCPAIEALEWEVLFRNGSE